MKSTCLLALFFVGCATAPPRPYTQQRELDAFAVLAGWQGARDIVLLNAANQYMAAGREPDGYALFGRLEREQPRRVLFSSLKGLMAARMAKEIPLLRRIAWVRAAMSELDRGARESPLVGRYLRGLVYAVLPPRFSATATAIADLEATLKVTEELPFPAKRGIYRALASAYAAKGDSASSKRFGQAAGSAPEGVLSDASDSNGEGFRFESPHLERVDDGLYVAENFDFSTIVFFVDPEGVIVVDAGTTVENARAALQALRRITRAPIRHLVFTHSHWDHVGGARAFLEAGTTVHANARFVADLEQLKKLPNPFRAAFWGKDPIPLDVRVDDLVTQKTTLRTGQLELDLEPGPSGETSDALYVHDRRRSLLLVGDAFMPYVGAPFVAEGSTDGYIEATRFVQRSGARRLIHGHPALSRYWTVDAMPGLERALVALSAHVESAAQAARPLADTLHDAFLPESLRETPDAALPFVVVRDAFVQRYYREHGGYWQADGTGLDEPTNDEQATALDLVAGGRESATANAARSLLDRGDAPMALRVAQLGLRRHPSSTTLTALEQQSLARLQARFQQVNPFRFIVYTGWSQKPVTPVAGAPNAP